MSSKQPQIMLAHDENGAPVLILREEEKRKRLSGAEALSSHIGIATSVAGTVSTSLGPKGRDKLIIDSSGGLTITNDGATIMTKMDSPSQIGKLITSLSKCQDFEIGDGTTGVVVLAGALLEHALKLSKSGIHPIRIADGFETALKIATKTLEESSEKFMIDNREKLIEVAMTTLGSKIINKNLRQMAEIAVDAVLSVADLERRDVDFELIKIRKKAGGKIEDTRLIKGLVLDTDFTHSQMAKEVKDAKIAILNVPLEPPKPEIGYKLIVDSVEKYESLYTTEQAFFTEMVDKIKASGATFVVCQWGFDDEANHLLYQAGIPAVRWALADEIEGLAIATGGSIISRFDDLSPSTLGNAKLVREETLGTQTDRIVTIEGCENEKIVTVFIRGSNEIMLDEAERALHDAMCVVRNLIRDPSIVFGGGAAELCASLAIEQSMEDVSTVEQRALRAFAEALDVIPISLARNSGLDPIKTLADLKAKQKLTKDSAIGVDCMERGTTDMRSQLVFETLSSKVQQFQLATQVTRMILKIDTSIDFTDKEEQGF
ncbi:TCP-1 chaperonin subunit epsilon [Aduncisulcus paluster]|uniref:T-complex protein 1 subunit epsilon n=1 Tax=Aduncisulcus paluster TaxID=2918883 RepID=A0ABQ5JZH7_9EUKA|nr:TCP-1 chaperonin subunit epsilon [Aduncisulcus paluster]